MTHVDTNDNIRRPSCGKCQIFIVFRVSAFLYILSIINPFARNNHYVQNESATLSGNKAVKFRIGNDFPVFGLNITRQDKTIRLRHRPQQRPFRNTACLKRRRNKSGCVKDDNQDGSPVRHA